MLVCTACHRELKAMGYEFGVVDGAKVYNSKEYRCPQCETGVFWTLTIPLDDVDQKAFRVYVPLNKEPVRNEQ